MGGIFISYRREDTAAYAGRLWENLRSHFADTDVFIDLDSLSAGVPFAHRIQEAIGECSVLIAMIGPSYMTTVDDSGNRRLDDPKDFVRLEVSAALRNKIPVIPVLVGGAVLPSRSLFPKRMGEMLSYNAVELSDQRWSYDVSRLIRAVEALAPADARESDASVDTLPEGPVGREMREGPRGHPRSQRAVLWVGLVVLAAGGVIVGLTFAGPTSSPGVNGDPADGGRKTPACVTTVDGLDNLACLASISATATAPDSHDNAGNLTTFKAENAVDGSPDTAWRAEGDATGQSLRLTFPTAVHVRQIGMIPGYAKTDPASGTDRFVQNRKVVEVRYEFDDGTTATYVFANSATMQYLSVDVRTRTIRVWIVRTAPGQPSGNEEARDYTPISEIDILAVPE
jgi:TIR domain